MAALGHHAYMRRRAIAVISLLLAVLAAAYGSTVFDRARPFGFGDPDSESSRAYERLEQATGEQAVPGVLLIVEAGAPVGSAPGLTEVSQVVRRLQSIDGIARVVQPRAGNGLVSQDGSLALVQGQLERSVSDQSTVGERVQEAFGGDDEILVGGPAVAAVQL
ncbi:MAG: hypothetical protein M3O25_05975, partial [Actinomycetota bacterium]|nr:hypothetical protein [Actinomycetota bacterium]